MYFAFLLAAATRERGVQFVLHRVANGAARKRGMTNAMFHELMAVVGTANETNRFARGYQVKIDEQFK
jgi:hypothetical protein